MNRIRCVRRALGILTLTLLITILSSYTRSTIAQVSTPATATPDSPSTLAKKEEPKSYKFSSRVHLKQGTTQGYLVVKVELNPGFHIYSITQKGAVPPTKLKVAESKQYKLGKFNPDTPAKITKDPWLKQDVEKHVGQVQFFAPIEFASNVDPGKLQVALELSGQVCGEQSCVQVNEKMKASFAGYFSPKPKKPESKSKPSIAQEKSRTRKR
ncbi:MAG: protein-disulfide reductase DsbD domain-containing protein [Planctomycetota bacterium]